ncbi:MFS transporter, partial [bacterium]|nr:MFS transporter [Candidatus Elulimicrobium humile]
KTWFSTDGLTLIQHVEHNVAGIVYPVVADPWWKPFVTAFKWIGGGVKVIAKKVLPWAPVLCLTGGGWAWYRSDAQGWVRVGDAVAGCLL